MSTAAWFHCFAGISGDMALGALVDAGADLDEVVGLCRRLPLQGWSVEARPEQRGGIAATRVVVRAEPTTVVRTAAHITALVEEARLPDRVRDRALATFTALARVEGALHRRPPSQVHFHEVGSVDAIVDVVGTCAALEVLAVDEVRASPVATGSGVVRTAHGTLPNPAPAVLRLLEGAPVRGVDVLVELTTPTGAALLAALASGFGPLPPMVVRSTGFGAGAATLPSLPNLTQVVVGEAGDRAAEGQPVTLLEANVDDVTGEVLAAAVGALLDAGAHDAWVTPIVMKKGRPAHTVSALVDPTRAHPVAQVLAEQTGSLGVRGTRLERWPSERRADQVEVAGVTVRVKVAAHRVKVEHDDALRVAQRTGWPLREALARAEEAWRAAHAPPAGADMHEPPSRG